MPVITRSQSKMYQISDTKSTNKPMTTNVIVWFNRIKKEKIALQKQLSTERKENKIKIRQIQYQSKPLSRSDIEMIKEYKIRNRNSYFETIRIVNELTYIIRSYIDQVYEQSLIKRKSLVFINKVFNNIQLIYQYIHKKNIIPETDEEKCIVKILLEELQEAERVLMPYLQK